MYFLRSGSLPAKYKYSQEPTNMLLLKPITDVFGKMLECFTRDTKTPEFIAIGSLNFRASVTLPPRIQAGLRLRL